jgi:hypothetical protein
LFDYRWPDGERTRTSVESQAEGETLSLRTRLAILDGTWPEFREVAIRSRSGGETEAEVLARRPVRFGPLCDLYLDLYVQVKNRSLRTKRNFLQAFKGRWEDVPLAGFGLLRF